MTMAGAGAEGRRRYREDRAAGIVDQAVALPFSPEENDAAAAMAEAFFGARYGLNVDSRLGRADFTITTEHRTTLIDVKWTPRPDGRLICYVKARVKADVYVLVTGRPPDFYVVGWAWGFRLRESVRDLGHGKTYVLDQDELHTNTDLLMATLGLVAA